MKNSLLHLLPVAVALCAGQAFAQSAKGGSSSSGAIVIDQARAEAGGVTAGDAPGFPVTISQPGSYRLQGNLTLPDANTTGIVITSPNVTLDLAGFAILGPCTSGCGAGSGDGIALQLPNLGPVHDRAAITIGNGTVRWVGGHGINGSFNGALRIERMNVLFNRQSGVLMNGGGTVANCLLAFNGQHGVAGSGVVLRDNEIRGNSLYGAYLNISSAGIGNVIQGNGFELMSGMRNLGGNLCGSTLCP
jgi:hypothetical protein